MNVLSTLKSEKGYIVPLRLVSAEGGNSQLSTNMLAPSFLTITVTEDNMNHEATQYTGTGTLVADQTGWTATTNGTVQSWYEPIEAIDNGTYWKTQGEIERNAEDCVFYAPLTARYIRITVPNAGGWYGASLECGVFNVYAK